MLKTDPIYEIFFLKRRPFFMRKKLLTDFFPIHIAHIRKNEKASLRRYEHSFSIIPVYYNMYISLSAEYFCLCIFWPFYSRGGGALSPFQTAHFQSYFLFDFISPTLFRLDDSYFFYIYTSDCMYVFFSHRGCKSTL